MSHKNSCRLCFKEYSNVKESKFQIFKADSSLQERLADIGIQVEETVNRSNTICKKCFQGIKWVEKGDEIRASWLNNTSGTKKRKFAEPDTNNGVSGIFYYYTRNFYCRNPIRMSYC